MLNTLSSTILITPRCYRYQITLIALIMSFPDTPSQHFTELPKISKAFRRNITINFTSHATPGLIISLLHFSEHCSNARPYTASSLQDAFADGIDEGPLIECREVSRIYTPEVVGSRALREISCRIRRCKILILHDHQQLFAKMC